MTFVEKKQKDEMDSRIKCNTIEKFQKTNPRYIRAPNIT